MIILKIIYQYHDSRWIFETIRVLTDGGETVEAKIYTFSNFVEQCKNIKTNVNSCKII